MRDLRADKTLCAEYLNRHPASGNYLTVPTFTHAAETGWPEAIDRALAAEAENAAMKEADRELTCALWGVMDVIEKMRPYHYTRIKAALAALSGDKSITKEGER